MDSDIESKARTIHRHSLRFRNYVLRGRSPEEVWKSAGFEPTFPQIRAMLMLHMSGTSTLKNLASALDISHPSASQMVDRLVDNGLVSREQDSDDRRRVLLKLTDKAQSCMGEHENAILHQIGILLEQMDPDFVEKWVELATYLSDILSRYPDLGIPGVSKSRDDLDIH